MILKIFILGLSAILLSGCDRHDSPKGEATGPLGENLLIPRGVDVSSGNIDMGNGEENQYDLHEFGDCLPGKEYTTKCSVSLSSGRVFLCNESSECSYASEGNNWLGWGSESCNILTERSSENCTYYLGKMIVGCDVLSCGNAKNYDNNIFEMDWTETYCELESPYIPCSTVFPDGNWISCIDDRCY